MAPPRKRRRVRAAAPAGAAVVVNGWSIFAHPLFLDQLERLTSGVEVERAKGKADTPNQKLLAAIHHAVFEDIPADPAARKFRQGDTLGPAYRHWFRAKFGRGRFRLFFRFQSKARIIVLGWLNDDTTLRTRGGRSDAYVVFRRMLESGNPPDTWEQLLAGADSPAARRRLEQLGR